MPFQVFVSYSTVDLATADALRAWIEQASARTFIAKYSIAPSENLTERIEGHS
jgi:hypothetical protein